jgi:nucleotide-binding universal stress UspA family protein
MKKLLICTDGSNYSQEACRYGAWLAQQTDAAIKILYVTDIRQFEVPAIADFSGSLGIQPYDGMISQLQEIELHKARFIEEHALRIFEQAGLVDRTSFSRETGLLTDIIDRYTSGVDLILLGKRGENADFAKEHLGSMLERVVRSSRKPCLVTSRAFKPIEKMAIAYDGGASCRKALRFLVEEQFFKTLELHLITAIEGGKADEAAAHLSEAEATAKAAGFSPTCQLLGGEVETAISDYVKTENIDLLVAGAYGHSRIREFLIGSTTTELLRRCYVPVLCFR